MTNSIQNPCNQCPEHPRLVHQIEVLEEKVERQSKKLDFIAVILIAIAVEIGVPIFGGV